MENPSKNYHYILSGYFLSQSTLLNEKNNLPNQRKLSEVLWQCAQAELWKPLFYTLSEPGFFELAWIYRETDVSKFWKILEQTSSYKMIFSYDYLLSSPQNYLKVIDYVGDLFLLSGYYRHALRFKEKIRNIVYSSMDASSDDYDESIAIQLLCDEASLCYRTMNYKKAFDLICKAEDISRSRCDWQSLTHILKIKVDILISSGMVEEVFLILKEGMEIAQRKEETELYIDFLIKAGHANRLNENYSEALLNLEKAEDLIRFRNDERSLAQLLSEKALIYTRQLRYKEAWICHEEEAEISSNLNEIQGVIAAVHGQVNILMKWKKYEQALELLNTVKNDTLKSGNLTFLAQHYGTKANIFHEQNKLHEALKWHNKEEDLFREIDNTIGLVISLVNQILIYSKLHERNKCLEKLNEALPLALKSGQKKYIDFINGFLRRL